MYQIDDCGHSYVLEVTVIIFSWIKILNTNIKVLYGVLTSEKSSRASDFTFLQSSGCVDAN